MSLRYRPLLNRVMDELDAKMQGVAGQLTSGQATDHGDYKRMIGHIRGLSDAREIMAKELGKEMEIENE